MNKSIHNPKVLQVKNEGIKAIAFDLDDTLVDTSGLLAPQATLAAFKVLIENGLKLTIDECEILRKIQIKSVSHKDVFKNLAHEFGTEQTIKSVPEAVDLFYRPTLPENLPLLSGANENLVFLKNKYTLYLVTAGFEKAQLAKAQALNIASFFKKIFVVNSLQKMRKRNSFEEILKIESIDPENLLCIGNSLTSEIQDAIELGAKSCYFEFGEDRGEANFEFFKKIDFRIKSHHELISTCKL